MPKSNAQLATDFFVALVRKHKTAISFASQLQRGIKEAEGRGQDRDVSIVMLQHQISRQIDLDGCIDSPVIRQTIEAGLSLNLEPEHVRQFFLRNFMRSIYSNVIPRAKFREDVDAFRVCEALFFGLMDPGLRKGLSEIFLQFYLEASIRPEDEMKRAIEVTVRKAYDVEKVRRLFPELLKGAVSVHMTFNDIYELFIRCTIETGYRMACAHLA